jgi:hypothetical protein
MTTTKKLRIYMTDGTNFIFNGNLKEFLKITKGEEWFISENNNAWRINNIIVMREIDY